jgi:voltage-gated potassium channel Kch
MIKRLDRHNNFAYLFTALILFLFTSAIVAEFSNLFSKSAFTLITLLMLAANIRTLKHQSTWKHVIYFLMPSFLVLSLLEHFFGGRLLFVLLLLSLLLIFFIGSFATAFRQVLFEGDIDANKLIGSLTLYIILGLIWTVIYLIILVLDPSAFTGLEVTNWQEGFSRIAYYSFVTLTTLGYGDILPHDHIAEFFVYMESIIGVFYMSIIVSSLISLRLAAMQENKKGK